MHRFAVKPSLFVQGFVLMAFICPATALYAGPTPPAQADAEYIATFSIVARDPDTGDLGVGVQSKYFSVGSVVPHARAGVGVIATQARGNVLFGPKGLDMLAAGLSPDKVLDKLLEGDVQQEERQVGIIDAQGRTETFTGNKTIPWAGGRTGQNYVVQGNLLAGPQVVNAMAAAFDTMQGDLATRLVMALAAGQAAGGDVRGRQSASVLVVRSGGGYMGVSDRYVDLHVEDHPAPIRELWRLLNIRLGEIKVKASQKSLNEARNLAAGPEKDALVAQALAQSKQALRHHNQSDAAWMALAEASLLAGDPSAAAAAGQRAVILNPMLKRYANQPETGLGPDPEVLEQLLAIGPFRRLWDALPDSTQGGAR
jgi:uncharacterized Ntn-hydrolase superfamily protein